MCNSGSDALKRSGIVAENRYLCRRKLTAREIPMMKTKSISKMHFVRLGLLLGAVAIIMAVVPRSSHESFSYEVNQPWKYRLLTAEFDIPIYRDAEGAARLRDSINRNFLPFVVRHDYVETEQVARFRTLMQNHLSPSEMTAAVEDLHRVYHAGIMQEALYDSVRNRGQHSLRTTQDNTDNPSTATTIKADGMYSPNTAFAALDSLYKVRSGGELMTQEMGKALLNTIRPNIELDSAIDEKYRSQEYLSVEAAQGVIKKGQRIVDLGEIVTPQIYTNLRTYETLLENADTEAPKTLFWLGQILYILLCYGMFYLYLAAYRPQYFSSGRQMTFLMVYTVAFVVLAVLMFESFNFGIYLVPFAAVPLVVLIFFDALTGVMALITTVLVSAIVATFQYQFIFMELSAGLVAVFSVRQLSRRSQLLLAAILAFLTYCLTYFISLVLETGTLVQFNLRVPGLLAINCIILSFAYFIILLVERMFGFTSAVTLVELSDINNKILRRLSEQAPGTFQHSMQVSTLASDAARAVGANVALVRTGALYHDIGKLSSPVFFTENQHGVNPHDGLSPQASAGKIISHVTEGLAMAGREKLPQVIRDFITEHHGRGLTKYFYAMAVRENPDTDPEPFRYPGPNPQTRETAILMMADAVEAASRSLQDYSVNSIRELVDRIIDGQLADGLYAESPLSFADIRTIKETFRKRLATIYHSRIAYPSN